jgi:dTDP-4-dehydrorhamnose 3,5-epimerase
MKQNKALSLIHGSHHLDERGLIRFVNDFDLTPTKRFYSIEHKDTNVVRAWQGHKIEEKYFHVVQGSFVIAAVEIDNWSTPSPSLLPQKFILKANESQVLHVPAGYANGFKALESNSIVMVFSSMTMDEAPKDDYRYDKDLWFNWNQNFYQD